ncbi:hypothetical protein [Streptomyces sp. NRRL F-5123]|uniref:hypothetical protein n=1 Tax=Streptomyces sp. NRRL F-5123 TaxID=1463856 RepID=UPI0004E23F47|nr:hypothetical protein [Streptomyces sp. NRRL F-5123]
MVAVSAALVALAPGLAYAGGRGDADGALSDDGKNITATAGVQYDEAANGSPSNGKPVGTPKAAGNWTPPPCWYEPYYTPAQLKAESETVWSEQSPSWEWISGQKDKYADGHPYTNFNMDKTGKGYWWSGYAPDFSVPGANDCQDEPFWVDKGATPPAGHRNAVTPEVLAELAYKKLLIPTGDPSIEPKLTQAVNLPTWVWLDPKDFYKVSVTAYLPDYGISATTTATPIGFRIESGGLDAEKFPASGNCPNLGTKYQPGANGNPPCGVTYLEDSNGNQVPLKVTVKWRVSWTGTGQPTPKALPAATFPSTVDVTVREIQTVNR